MEILLHVDGKKHYNSKMHISYCTFSPYFYHRLRLINITTFCECQGIILILHSVRDNADYLRSENTRPRCPYLCIIFFF